MRSTQKKKDCDAQILQQAPAAISHQHNKENKTSYAWEDTWHVQEEKGSQNRRDEGGKYAKDRVRTVPIDGSLKGAPRKYAAIGNGIVQLGFDHKVGPKYENMVQSQKSEDVKEY